MNLKKLTKSLLMMSLAASLVHAPVVAASNTYNTSEYSDENFQLRINSTTDKLSIYADSIADTYGYMKVRTTEFDGSVQYPFYECQTDSCLIKLEDLSIEKNNSYRLEIYLSDKEDGTYIPYYSGAQGIILDVSSKGVVTFGDAPALRYNAAFQEELDDSTSALNYYSEVSSTTLKEKLAKDSDYTSAIKYQSGDELALAIHDYVATNYAVDTKAAYDESYTTANQVYTNQYGSSLGIANLTAEILRINRFPAMVVLGEVSDNLDSEECRSKRINHAWVEFYDGATWQVMDVYADMANTYNGTKLDLKSGMKNRKFFMPSIEQYSLTHIAREVANEYVDETVYVSNITLGSSLLVIDENDKGYIDATVYPQNAANKSLKYVSSDTNIVTVSAAGVLTPQKTGTATITVSSTDGSNISVTCKVEVTSSVVKEISVDVTKLNLDIYESKYLAIEVLPKTASDTSYTITSSNPAIASVTNTGLVKGRTQGSTTIKIVSNSDNKIYKEIPVVVSSTKVTKSFIKAEKEVYDLLTGESAPLSLRYGTTENNYATVTFSSNDTSIVKVSKTGEITAVGKGVAKVTMMVDDGTEVKDYVFVNVEENEETTETKIVLEENKVTLGIEETCKIDATVSPSSVTLSYVSTNTAVAEVSAKGVITGIGVGTANIIVSANDGSGAYASLVVTVSGDGSLIKAIDLGTNEALVSVGGTYKITSTISPSTAKNKDLTYISGNTAIATVSSSGIVTGVAKGSATITVFAADGSGISQKITVNVVDENIVYIDSLSVPDPILTLKEGQTYTIDETITPTNATDDTIIYTSSDEKVATVNAKGKIYAEELGEAIITLSTQDGSGKKATISLLVIGKNETIKVSSIAIEQTKIVLDQGDTERIKYTIYPTSAENQVVTYSSTNPSVASVNESGVVSAVGEGSAIISVSAVDGSKKVATVAVTVNKKVEEEKPEEPDDPNDVTPSKLLDYSKMDMNVYENSRVTSIKSTSTGFIIKGYMFEKGVNWNNANKIWREIVFVNTEDVSTARAYRKQATSVKNPWLNNNVYATENGKYDLTYANYELTVNTSNLNTYKGNVPGAQLASGDYYMFMRISNGKESYLFPLKDITLSDGTNMENTGTLPKGFSIKDQTSRVLIYTQK